MAIKKTKTEVQKIENGLTDPVALMNQERGIDYKGKLRSTEADIKAVQNEKNMLEE